MSAQWVAHMGPVMSADVCYQHDEVALLRHLRLHMHGFWSLSLLGSAIKAVQLCGWAMHTILYVTAMLRCTMVVVRASVTCL